MILPWMIIGERADDNFPSPVGMFMATGEEAPDVLKSAGETMKLAGIDVICFVPLISCYQFAFSGLSGLVKSLDPNAIMQTAAGDLPPGFGGGKTKAGTFGDFDVNDYLSSLFGDGRNKKGGDEDDAGEDERGTQAD